MRTFRRRKSREPFFWVRNAFETVIATPAGEGSLPLANSKVSNVDQLAIGAVTFTGIDERYTARRILWPVAMVQRATPSDKWTRPWVIIVKTSTSALTNLVNESFLSVVSGGSTNIPAAMDVLQIQLWSMMTVAGSASFTVGAEFREVRDFDVKVSRRLEADECIAALSGCAHEGLAAGNTITTTIDWSVSTLYSRTLRRR